MKRSLEMPVADGGTNGRTDGTEFIGPLSALPGVQKGVYPYEYMNSFEKFSEKKLPDRCNFYSSLEDAYISEKTI